MVKTPRWENLMPLYFEILAKKPKGKAQQELLDLVKEECMRAARMMDRSVDYETPHRPQAEFSEQELKDLYYSW